MAAMEPGLAGKDPGRGGQHGSAFQEVCEGEEQAGLAAAPHHRNQPRPGAQGKGFHQAQSAPAHAFLVALDHRVPSLLRRFDPPECPME